MIPENAADTRKKRRLLADFTRNADTVRRLRMSIGAGTVSHAYLFECADPAEARDFADCFAKALLCRNMPGSGCAECAECRKIEHGNHRDVTYVEPNEKGNIVTAQIAGVIGEISYKPDGDRRIVIIEQADRMNDAARNKILKTLEEPPEGTVIALLCASAENMPKTILSRCALFRLTAEETTLDVARLLKAESVLKSILERDPFFSIKRQLESAARSREEALVLLDDMEKIYRDMAVGRNDLGRLCGDGDIFRAVRLIESARREIMNNVGYRNALKELAIRIGGL